MRKEYKFKTVEDLFNHNNKLRKINYDNTSSYIGQFLIRANEPELQKNSDTCWNISFEVHKELVFLWLGIEKNSLSLEELITYCYLFRK